MGYNPTLLEVLERTMTEYDVREEVVNVMLAELLQQRGLLSIPETIRKSISGHTRQLPDITVADLLGLRIVIEGRFNKGAPTRDSLLKDAQKRVEQGISAVCLAALYPPELRAVESLPKLRQKLDKAKLTIRVVSENSDDGWREATVDDVADALRRSYELLVSDDVVVKSVADIEDAIDGASEIFVNSKGLKERFRKTLGIPAEDKREDKH